MLRVPWFDSSFVRGDRMTAPSGCIAHEMIERYGYRPNLSRRPHARSTPPHSSPVAVSAKRIARLRRVWDLQPEIRPILVPGRLAPWTGPNSVINAAHMPVGGDPHAWHQHVMPFRQAGPRHTGGPPRMRDKLRTDWLVGPGHVGETARAVNATVDEALGAQQFAEFMFSPQSVAEAICEVYTSLLARNA